MVDKNNDHLDRNARLEDLKKKLNSKAAELPVFRQKITNMPMAVYDARYTFKEIAEKEMTNSQLPGRHRGPADAYRHTVWVGLMAQKYGQDTALAVSNMREIGGIFGDTPSIMDYHNNVRAAATGNVAYENGITDPQWTINRAREEILKGGETDAKGHSDSNSPVWLQPDQWSKNPKYDIDSRVPKELQGKEMPLDQMNWPQDKINWENPYQNNPYIPTPPAKSEQPGKDDESQDSSDASSVPKTVREELEAQFSKDRNNQAASDPDTPHPDETDAMTGKKFKDMTAGEYAAALYRHRKGQAVNQNTAHKADNDNRPTNAGGEVHVSAYDREGGKEHVRAHNRHKPT